MAEDINITYKIEEDELICLESNDTDGEYIRWNNQKNMRYSIGDMPFNINFARLSEEFRVVDGINVVVESSNPAKIKIRNTIESTKLDNRIKNLVYYSWDKTFIDSSTVIETDLDGILVKGIKINDGESVRFGEERKGCIYAAKSNLDKGYLTPLMSVNGLITIIKNNNDYKCYLLRSVDDEWSHWVELVVNKTVYFYCNYSDWNGTCYDTSTSTTGALLGSYYGFSFDSPTCQAYYDSYYSITENGRTEVQKSPATVQWSINSYDIDSENNLRNFLLDENGSQFVRNKYTNNEPITMCQAIPVDDVISENGQDVSSSNKCYILFDYQSNDTQQYALYSPELLETYGIGFIRSDWIIYDKDGNLRVEFWPEKASNLLFDKTGNKTLETATGNYEHSASNPLYGCIKSFRTAKDVVEVGISDIDELANEAIFSNTKENVRILLQNRASVCRCYKMFKFQSTSSVLLNDKPLYIKTDGTGSLESKMIHYCKAEYNNDYSTYNDVTVSHVTKKDQQLAFRFAKLVQHGKVENDADEIQNLCVWFYNDTYKMPQLYYIDDYRSYNSAVIYATITDCSDDGEYYSPLGACVSNVVAYMDEENQPLLQYERWKNVLQYIYSDANRTIWAGAPGSYYYDPSQNTRTIVKGTSKIYTKIAKYSPADENAEENVEKVLEEDGWMTPNDYYNTKVNTSNVDTGSLGYTRASTATDEIKGYWFWVDELKNWCIWRRTNRAFLHLYVWNGRNGWDKLEDIVNAWAKFDWQTLKRIYFYNPTVISSGVFNNNFSSMATTFKDGNDWKPALMAINSYQTIILKRDTSISTYDSETFQNIHSSSVLYVDNGGAHMGVTIPGDTTYGGNTTHIGKVKKDWGAIVMPVVGCPCVVRNTNGQLNLMYVNKLDGNFTINDDTNEVLYFKDEGVRYLNSVCKTFFGNGDEFKIEDWKKFTKKDNTEERASKMYSNDEESLYGAPPLINSEAEKINMKMTMTSPRPNVGTKSVKNEDYILRWNR